MASQSITTFINGFNGGTRLNRFEVEGTIASIGNVNTTQTYDPKASNSTGYFHIRSATLPEAVLGEIMINYRGRTVSYPGDRTYKPWNITVLDDITGGGGKNLHQAFSLWSNTLNSHEKNTNGYSGAITPKVNFATNWAVKQFDSDGAKLLKTFNIKNCWPALVGPIQLDMSQDNTLATFNVTLFFTHFTYTMSDT